MDDATRTALRWTVATASAMAALVGVVTLGGFAALGLLGWSHLAATAALGSAWFVASDKALDWVESA